MFDWYDLLYYGSYALFGFAILYGIFRAQPGNRTLVEVTCQGIYFGRGPSLEEALCEWFGLAFKYVENDTVLEMMFRRGEETMACPVRFEVIDGERWHLTVTFDEETCRTVVCSLA